MMHRERMLQKESKVERMRIHSVVAQVWHTIKRLAAERAKQLNAARKKSQEMQLRSLMRRWNSRAQEWRREKAVAMEKAAMWQQVGLRERRRM
ncbi:unnamed protein product [Aphanomyces euteiches]